MTGNQIQKNKLSFNPDIAAESWRKRQQEKEKQKPINPEELAEQLSDRLIKVMEEEMKRQKRKKKTG